MLTLFLFQDADKAARTGSLVAVCGQPRWALSPGMPTHPSALTSAAQLGSGQGSSRDCGENNRSIFLHRKGVRAKTELKAPERNSSTHRNFRKGSDSNAHSSMVRISLQDRSLFQLQEQMSLPSALLLLPAAAACIPGGTKATCPWLG